MKGQQYLGFSTSDGKFKQNTVKTAKVIGPTCTSATCEKSKMKHCQKYNDETRKTIFQNFWSMSWEAKRVYVNSYVSHIAKKRSTVENSKNNNSFVFRLPYDHRALQVCRSMFLSTLSIKIDMVKGWLKVKKRQSFSPICNNQRPTLKSKTVGSKIYLKEFSLVFAEQNLGIFMPRKDQCDTCVGYKAKQISKDEYDRHIGNKKRAQDEKLNEKLAAQEGRRHVFTMNAQAVKLCPDINASAIYYKQRLQVHNFTIYNLATHQCTNYWWNESDGDLSASTFISCIIHHLKTHCLSDTLPITILVTK